MKAFPLVDREPTSIEVMIACDKNHLKLMHDHAERTSRLFSVGHTLVRLMSTDSGMMIPEEEMGSFSLGATLYESLSGGLRGPDAVDDELLVDETVARFREKVLNATLPLGVVADINDEFGYACPQFSASVMEVSSQHASDGVVHAMAGAACMWAMHTQYERAR